MRNDMRLLLFGIMINTFGAASAYIRGSYRIEPDREAGQ